LAQALDHSPKTTVYTISSFICSPNLPIYRHLPGFAVTLPYGLGIKAVTEQYIKRQLITRCQLSCKLQMGWTHSKYNEESSSLL